VYVESQKSKVESPPPERYVPKFYKWCTGILLSLLAVGIGMAVWKVANKRLT